MKGCTGCERLLAFDQFYPDARRPDGLRSRCRGCVRTGQQAARERARVKAGRVGAPRGQGASVAAEEAFLRVLDMRAELDPKPKVQTWEATCMQCGELRVLKRVPTPKPLVTRLGLFVCARCYGPMALSLVRGPVVA